MNYNILVVDDTRFMRMMLSDILNNYGHKVVAEAANGLEAVKLYGEHRPDVVIMDINMPVMNGIEAMKEIKHHDPSAVILICAAMSQQEFISDALQLGAAGYVLKPFEADKVNEIVCKFGLTKVKPDEDCVETFIQSVSSRLNNEQGGVKEADSLTNSQDFVEPYKFQEETHQEPQQESQQEEDTADLSDRNHEGILSMEATVEIEEHTAIHAEDTACGMDIINIEIELETDMDDDEEVSLLELELDQEQEVESAVIGDSLVSMEEYDELHLDFHEYLAQIHGVNNETVHEELNRVPFANVNEEAAQEDNAEANSIDSNEFEPEPEPASLLASEEPTPAPTPALGAVIATEPYIRKTNYESSNVINLSSGIYCAWDEYVAESIVTYKVMMNDGETLFMEAFLETSTKVSIPFSLNSLRRLLDWADNHKSK